MTNRADAVWRAVMGPVGPKQGGATMAVAAAAALVVGRRTLREKGPVAAIVTGVVAFDLVGGMVSFRLESTRRQYAGHDVRQRLLFAAAHVQPFVLPITGQGNWSRAAVRYGLALAATAALEAFTPTRPGRGMIADALGAALALADLASDRSKQRWLGPVYLIKLVGGHGGVGTKTGSNPRRTVIWENDRSPGRPPPGAERCRWRSRPM